MYLYLNHNGVVVLRWARTEQEACVLSADMFDEYGVLPLTLDRRAA